ncbi:MAG: hypothetical protein KDD64_02325 [Bdellovibrionales bacterium]|nr:hypothetical protein [Bdellovibrionales bacterium]
MFESEPNREPPSFGPILGAASHRDVIAASNSTQERPLDSLITPESIEPISHHKISQILSRDEISTKMKRSGFPELELLWKQFSRSRDQSDSLDPAKIESARTHHMGPLFSHPKLGLTLAAGAGLGAALLFSKLGVFDFPQFGTFGRGLLIAASALNNTFLTLYSATLAQRYVFFPMGKILRRDTAHMLSQRSYRATHEASGRTRELREDLSKIGINENWDNPGYEALYQTDGKIYHAVKKETEPEFCKRVLREFLGSKNEETRRFEPGRYTSCLSRGKASVTAFVKLHSEALARLREDEMTYDECKALLEDLCSHFLEVDSAGMLAARSYLAAIERGDQLDSKAVKSQVWQRDPWRDLTHQEEFYSSASLRGVKWMGRGPKGRLGTFGYLKNPSISALDFSTSKGRMVRARIAAALAEDSSGQKVPVLFVDGVEGSNALPPKVLQLGIEEYAQSAGFHSVVYNRFVHNQIPKRFVESLADQGMPLRQMKIRFADCREREYLDAFALPIEPFEYSYPRGTVLAYTRQLREGFALQSREPSRIRLAFQETKRKALWLITGEAVGFAGVMTALSTPKMLLPLGIFALAGAWLQKRHEGRSLQKAK